MIDIIVFFVTFIGLPSGMRVRPLRGRSLHHEQSPQVPFGHPRLCIFAAFGDGMQPRHEQSPQVPFGHPRLCIFAAFGDMTGNLLAAFGDGRVGWITTDARCSIRCGENVLEEGKCA